MLFLKNAGVELVVDQLYSATSGQTLSVFGAAVQWDFVLVVLDAGRFAGGQGIVLEN